MGDSIRTPKQGADGCKRSIPWIKRPEAEAGLPRVLTIQRQAISKKSRAPRAQLPVATDVNAFLLSIPSAQLITNMRDTLTPQRAPFFVEQIGAQ
jgi:hypothetical protein